MKSLISFVTNLVNRKSHITNTNTKSFASAWLRGREDTTTPAVLASAYQQSTWVYACISTLAETVSAIPFRLVEGSGNPATGPGIRPLESLFQRPHPQLDRFQFWELIVSWLMLRGEAFVYSEMEGRTAGAPESLLILSPDHLHEITLNGELAGWRYTGSHARHPGAPSVFLPEDLVHIRLPNPFNFFRGMSPLTVAYLAAQTDYAASQFMKGTMLNNADTGLIVTTSEQLSPEQIEDVKAALRERKRAAGTADKPLFLWGGANVQKPAISSADMQFLENRKFNRQEICAIFKVPQEILGFTEDANRSVSESARLNFMENRIAPLCKRLEAAIQPIIDGFAKRRTSAGRGSVGLHAGVRGEFHIQSTPIMQAAQRARVQTALRLFSLGVPVNIINRNLDLGLPDLPHGQTCYLPDGVHASGEVEPALPKSGQKSLQHDPAERILALLPALQLQLGDERTDYDLH